MYMTPDLDPGIIVGSGPPDFEKKNLKPDLFFINSRIRVLFFPRVGSGSGSTIPLDIKLYKVLIKQGYLIRRLFENPCACKSRKCFISMSYQKISGFKKVSHVEL